MGLEQTVEHSHTSHGPIATQMPVFTNEGNEIMSVFDQGDGTIQAFQENFDEPQQLDPSFMHRVDFEDLLAAQQQETEQYYADLADQEQR